MFHSRSPCLEAGYESVEYPVYRFAKAVFSGGIFPAINFQWVTQNICCQKHLSSISVVDYVV
jgi:hypothetical protein